jgi:hypothetical protein
MKQSFKIYFKGARVFLDQSLKTTLLVALKQE